MIFLDFSVICLDFWVNYFCVGLLKLQVCGGGGVNPDILSDTSNVAYFSLLWERGLKIALFTNSLNFNGCLGGPRLYAPIKHEYPNAP